MILFNPKCQAFSSELSTIPQRFSQEGEIIYDSRNQIRIIKLSNGTEVCVKRFHAPRALNCLIYSLGIRKPKGERAFEYPSRLLIEGIETPITMAYIEHRNMGLLRESYLISEKCPYSHCLYELGDAPRGTYENLALALAQMTARMHEAGILHQDFSPGNILWEKLADGYHFSLVDINRMYFGKVGMKQGCSNFVRLWGPKRFLSIIVREYARLRNFDADECERILMERRARFWEHYKIKRKIKFTLEL